MNEVLVRTMDGSAGVLLPATTPATKSLGWDARIVAQRGSLVTLDGPDGERQILACFTLADYLGAAVSYEVPHEDRWACGVVEAKHEREARLAQRLAAIEKAFERPPFPHGHSGGSQGYEEGDEHVDW